MPALFACAAALALSIAAIANPQQAWPGAAPPTQAEIAASPAGQSEQPRLEELGSYLKRLADADKFSGTVVIARDGKPIFAQAHGYADRDEKIPNTVNTPFLLGSMNKLFTGLAIGQLVEQGKLAVEPGSVVEQMLDLDPLGALGVRIIGHELRERIVVTTGRDIPAAQPASRLWRSGSRLMLLGDTSKATGVLDACC